MSRFQVSACTAEHIGDRSEQQDRVAILTSRRNPGALLAVVADGMGGRTGGRLASDQVVSTADGLFQETGEADSAMAPLLQQIATEAHTVIRLNAISSEKEPHSTMVALIVKRTQAVWVHAGDSRLYFFRGRRLLHRTADHSYAAHLAAAGRPGAASVAEKKYKNVIASALGIAGDPQVTLGEANDLQAGDQFMLCSDGLWAYFEDDELASLLNRLSPRQASEQLIRLARERARGRGDNISLAIIKLNAAPPPTAG